ncbi:MAG: quinone-dependent dihydroorotate dehydrogenase [Elusimicrobia bacterium]|nr:quinone-dependent dihydroorotate dehydrogenase [Elusimicrobiota bacterium]MDE2511678.1 quinone-dependent dihydroorotate dehydrogenase [Elusimicrobiota bacterium]
MLYELAKPFLFSLDAERAHEEVSGLMELLAPLPGAASFLSILTGAGTTGLGKDVFGIHFPNPAGLAAGFDKDGRLVPLLPALGFGFLEIGSVTLEPQPGNPRPRMFRLPENGALINRMGFNSEGARAVARRLASGPKCAVPLGINLGLNKGTEPAKAPAAYARTFHILAEHGDYFVVNVSSPNTPGLRDLQKAAELKAILEAVQEANVAKKPVLLKLAPDLADEDFAAAIETADELAQGLVVSNTTISREGMDEIWRGEAGGLSGAPLKERATEMTRRARALTKLPIIGVGGIATGDDARERLAAGADLVQIYTSLIYGGPSTAKKIVRSLSKPATAVNDSSMADNSGRTE